MKMKTCERNLKHRCKNSLKTIKATPKGLKKEKIVEGMSDKDDCGGFAGFEWQKWRIPLGSGFFKVKQMRKEEEKGA